MNTDAEPCPRLIEQAADLSRFCEDLADAEWIAVDMEFVRDQSYFPQFCLIQVATPEFAACIDPIAITDLAPLLDLLYRPDVCKVFHAARQDLEILYHLRGALPENVADTQIAAALLGLPDQVGYGALVAELLGIALAKSHARTDWRARPLTPAQLQYALDDVVYLARCWPTIELNLRQNGRLPWLAEECRELLDPALYENPPELAWTRFGAADKLNASQLAVLKALAAWREQEAQRSDTPRGWVIKDDVLLTLVKAKPKTTSQLRQIRGIPERTLKTHGDALCALIADAGNRPEATAPARAYIAKTPQQEALLDVLSAVLRLVAEENRVAAGLVANRKDLEALARGDPASRLLRGWRRDLVGDELRELLTGATALRVQEGELRITPAEPEKNTERS